MKKIFFITLQMLILSLANAQMYVNKYSYGKVKFTETERSIEIQLPNTDIYRVDILPGGKVWPPLLIDEDGDIFFGNKIFNSKAEKLTKTTNSNETSLIKLPFDNEVIPTPDGYLFKKRNHICRISKHSLQIKNNESSLESLKRWGISIAADEQNILVLRTAIKKGNQGDEKINIVFKIDVTKCKIISQEKLGDPDNLLELAWSKEGGWWITGSIEGILLRSKNGSNWHKVPLPNDISSLVSSYVINQNEIWLAAVLASSIETDPYLLIYSGNGGQTWVSMKKDDPLLSKLPLNWIEGLSRVSAAKINEN